jgi:predicted nucleotidyltransferase
MRPSPLTKEQAIQRLLATESEIRALGVERLALFGSLVRGETRPDSDIDILIQFLPGEKKYARFLDLADLLEQRLERPVDLVTIEGLSPFVGPHILAEAQDVLRAR